MATSQRLSLVLKQRGLESRPGEYSNLDTLCMFRCILGIALSYAAGLITSIRRGSRTAITRILSI